MLPFFRFSFRRLKKRKKTPHKLHFGFRDVTFNLVKKPQIKNGNRNDVKQSSCFKWPTTQSEHGPIVSDVPNSVDRVINKMNEIKITTEMTTHNTLSVPWQVILNVSTYLDNVEFRISVIIQCTARHHYANRPQPNLFSLMISEFYLFPLDCGVHLFLLDFFALSDCSDRIEFTS